MAKPILERNGESEVQEVELETSKKQDVTVSPVATTESPDKWVVFRSKDKELALFQKAGYMDKSLGSANYIPSIGVQFIDFYFRIQDIPKYADMIKWLRGHPSNGISFKEVPDLNNVVELPTIAELKQMVISELKELCAKNKVEVDGDASKESIIIALLENV
jgi:hypothetical protein